jgi:hypothetical protein
MDFRKVSSNGGAASVSLPKKTLEELEIVDQDGEIQGDQYAQIEHEGSGRFTVNLVGAD